MVTDPGTICAYDCMQEDEAQEKPVIVQAHTLINPDAMMVLFLNAKVASAAMLGTRWFLKLA